MPPSTDAKLTTVTETSVITPLVVRVLLAHRRLALVASRTIAMQSSAVEVASACSTSCWGVVRSVVISVPASSMVLRMLTPRNSALGQPWLTAATWPGWALPQLNAPPSTQVSGPPTASIEPQKSVVVAW